MVHSSQKLGLDGCVDVVLGGSREAVRRCAASSASHGERPSRLFSQLVAEKSNPAGDHGSSEELVNVRNRPESWLYRSCNLPPRPKLLAKISQKIY